MCIWVEMYRRDLLYISNMAFWVQKALYIVLDGAKGMSDRGRVYNQISPTDGLRAGVREMERVREHFMTFGILGMVALPVLSVFKTSMPGTIS